MKRQLASAALFGVGLLSVVAAAALVFLIVPLQSRIPYDLQPPEARLAASDATFLHARELPNGDPQVTVERGDLTVTTGIKPDLTEAAKLRGKLANQAVIWNVYQATDRVDTGEPVNRAESRIALDRSTGAALDWSGQCFNDEMEQRCTAGNVEFSGQLYAFPFGTEKRTYQYYDTNLHAPLPVKYVATETVNGMRAYRFEQSVSRQPVETDEETLRGLVGFLAPAAESGSMYYEADRTLWVEPATGAILNYRERQHRELVPDTGAPVVLLDATFEYDEKTQQQIRTKASEGRGLLLLYGRYVPIGLAAVGIALGVWGILLARGRRRPESPDPAHPRAETPVDAHTA